MWAPSRETILTDPYLHCQRKTRSVHAECWYNMYHQLHAGTTHVVERGVACAAQCACVLAAISGHLNPHSVPQGRQVDALWGLLEEILCPCNSSPLWLKAVQPQARCQAAAVHSATPRAASILPSLKKMHGNIFCQQLRPPLGDNSKAQSGWLHLAGIGCKEKRS